MKFLTVISLYVLFELRITTLFIFRHKDVEFVIPGSKRMSSSTTCLYQGTYNAPGSSRRNSQVPINVSGRNISRVKLLLDKRSKYKLTQSLLHVSRFLATEQRIAAEIQVLTLLHLRQLSIRYVFCRIWILLRMFLLFIEITQTHLTNIYIISRGGIFSQMCFQPLRGLSLQRHQEEAPGLTVGDVAILDYE